MLGQARVEHACHRRVPDEHLGDALGVVAVPVHAHRERLDPAQHEPAVERARAPRPTAFWVNASCSPSSSSLADQRARRRRRSGRRGTWWWSARRRRRRARAAAAGRARRRCCRRRAGRRPACATSATAAMSTMPSSGLVGVSIQTTRVVGRSAARSGVEVGEVDGRVLDAPRREDLVDQPEGAAVGVVRDHQVVAGAHEHAQQHVARAPCRERERAGVPAALQGGETLLAARCGWGSAAGVLVAARRVPPTPSWAKVDDRCRSG